MKKFLIYSALFFITQTTNAQTFFPQTGFVFFNNNNFAVHNYAPFGLGYPAASLLPIRAEGYDQLNDSSCNNFPVIFSSDGLNAYNGSNGSIIPGTTGLLGEANSTNAATIVPISGNRALIITTKAWFNTTNLAYSSILNYTGSCGSYTFNMPAATKNLPLPISATGVTSICEKLTVVKKTTGNDYWLIMHEATNAGLGSNKYLVYNISYATGVISAHMDFNQGLPIKKIGGKGQMQAIRAQIPGTIYNHFIGSAYFIRPGSPLGAVDLLYFDASVGGGTIFLKETIISTWDRPYGLEFDRSGSIMYVGSRMINKTMTRYNPYAVTVAPGVPNTLLAPIPNKRFGQLQCLDNNSIYAPLRNTTTLFYIPLAGTTTSFPGVSPYATLTGAANFFWGLPNYWRN
jgi:hypothetical protein